MELIDNINGGYRFASGIAPYSAGVVALPGFEIVHVTLQQSVPYRDGFVQIDRWLSGQNRPRMALCAVELRLPTPVSFDGFAEFNAGYQQMLSDWDLMIDGRNPVARTNIAPALSPPDEPSLYAFSYTDSSDTDQPTFIVAGAGDLRDQAELSPDAIVRRDETSPDAMREKAETVMAVMHERLSALQVTADALTAVHVYTVQPLHAFLSGTILEKLPAAARHGVCWHYSRPPIAGLEFEMDMRGVRRELRLT